MAGTLAGLVVALLIVGLMLARRWVSFVWAVLRPAAWPAAWGLFLMVALGKVGQGQALVQRALETSWWMILPVCLLAGLLMGYASACLLFVRYAPIVAQLEILARQLKLPPTRYDRLCDRLRRTFPPVVAALPLLALLPGAAGAVLPSYRGFATTMALLAVAAVAVAMWRLAGTRWLQDDVPSRRRWLWPLRYPSLSDGGIRDARGDDGAPLDRLPPGTRWAFAVAILLAVASFAAAGLWPVGWSQRLGTATIVVIGTGSIAVIGALAAYYINRRFSVTIPYALFLLLLAAGLFARWELSDNHAVREVATGEREAEERLARVRPTLEEHLAEWLEARPSPGANGPAAPYPLIVAAAQGGGVRAALWTALALGELQSRIPTLPCDLFAIVGVSGGALGAASYAAMLAEGPPACGPGAAPPQALAGDGARFRAAAEAAFGGDLLAPAAAGMFFPDLVQRLWPFPHLPDRQRYLEAGWEEAWAQAGLGMGRLDRPFLSLFPAERRARLPALFLVASEVEGGRRWIASNVRIDRNRFPHAVDTLTGRQLVDTDDLRDSPIRTLPISAAVGLSARFPYVSPAATFRLAGSTFHLLDGGAVESSGAATASDILLALRSHCGAVPGVSGVLGCEVVQPSAATAREPARGWFPATAPAVACGSDRPSSS
jgi:hypothetical protein